MNIKNHEVLDPAFRMIRKCPKFPSVEFSPKYYKFSSPGNRTHILTATINTSHRMTRTQSYLLPSPYFYLFAFSLVLGVLSPPSLYTFTHLPTASRARLNVFALSSCFFSSKAISVSCGEGLLGNIGGSNRKSLIFISEIILYVT